MKSYDIIQNCSIGDEYVNIHSKSCSDLFAFNNNVAIGDIEQIFYCTTYSTKQIQDEDSF